MTSYAKINSWSDTAGSNNSFVVQTVVATTTSAISSTSGGTTVASGFIISIKPQYQNSKLLLRVIGGNINWGNTAATHNIYIYRQIGANNGYSNLFQYHGANYQSSTWGLNQATGYLDSPNTTDYVYYQPYFNYGTSNRGDINTNNNVFSMIVEEIRQ